MSSSAAIELNCVCHTGPTNLIQGAQKPNINPQDNEYLDSVTERSQQAKKKKTSAEGFVSNIPRFIRIHCAFTQSEKN